MAVLVWLRDGRRIVVRGAVAAQVVRDKAEQFHGGELRCLAETGDVVESFPLSAVIAHSVSQSAPMPRSEP